MTHEEKARAVKLLRGIQDRMGKHPEFLEDADRRAIFVTLATLEGAIMFGDLQALADVCAEFCKKKSDDVIQSN